MRSTRRSSVALPWPYWEPRWRCFSPPGVQAADQNDGANAWPSSPPTGPLPMMTNRLGRSHSAKIVSLVRKPASARPGIAGAEEAGVSIGQEGGYQHDALGLQADRAPYMVSFASGAEAARPGALLIERGWRIAFPSYLPNSRSSSACLRPS